MTLHFTKVGCEALVALAARDGWHDEATHGLAQDWLALHAENERLRAALAQVEWMDGVCPWCDGLKNGNGHAPDCPRQAALKGTQP